MITLPYNPFKCEPTELKAQDLEILKSIAEGWYIEYKREISKPKPIAKSLSAFANHYGGWLFYGIASSSDGNNFAGSFPGIETSEIPKCLEDIRNAARDCVNPAPYYETKVLAGPCSEIGLLQDRSIIVVVIPSGADAPHVHIDARIYRRVADSSDPKQETDRFILDQLWQRRQQAQRKLKTFLERRPEISKSEENASFVHVLLSVDPLGTRQERSNLTFDEFKDLMTSRELHGMSIGIPFDNFFVTSGGMICRLVGINDPSRLLLTFKYNLDASAEISIPFSSWDIQYLEKFGAKADATLNEYEQIDQIIHLLKEQGHESGQLLDMNSIFFLIAMVLANYDTLLKKSNINGPVYVKVILRNIWRRIPFLDTPEYVKYVQNNGFPLIQENELLAPPGDTFDSLKIMTPSSTNEDTQLSSTWRRLLEASELMIDVANAFGIRGLTFFDQNGDWVNAGNRASSIAQKQFDLGKGMKNT